MYKKILIINPFGIGDVLFTTPIIHTLKDAYPGARIGYICNGRTAALLQSNPYVDCVYVYDRDEFNDVRRESFFAWLKKNLEFMGQLRKGRFDLALDLSLNSQYGFFSWYAGIKERVGYDYKNRGIFLTKKWKLSGYSQMHVVEYYARLLESLGLVLKYRGLELYLKDGDKIAAEEILSKEGISHDDFLAGVIPGGGRSWGKDAYLKHWPPENFAGLADKLVEKYKAKIIIMGDFSEKEIARKVIKNMQHKAIDLCGETTVGKMAALLEKMSLVITNDGGPLHMAAALGKKTLSFFGPVDPKVYGPYPYDKKRHIILRKDLECSPCYKGFRLIDCKQKKECLKAISVEEALEALSPSIG